jgi:hypothetical protein
MPVGFDTSIKNQGCTFIRNKDTSSTSLLTRFLLRVLQNKGKHMKTKKTMIEKQGNLLYELTMPKDD